MSIIREIAAQRQKLLDGIDANEGDINLSIFEDFYPDEAHFIYELLQNAEDAGATEASFELEPGHCVFQHNGSRHFNERDIRGITGIFNSSKKASPDKIGKFGVGFKSVFVYTDSPCVYSKHHSFKILNLVLPQEIPPKPSLLDRTCFEIPFNSPKKNAGDAYNEVRAGLEQLSETTLLFLSNLKCISWRIGTKEAAMLREEHSESHVEILALVGEAKVHSSHWLRFSASVQDAGRFSAPIEGVEKQRVAVAYELAFIGDVKTYDRSKSLSEQLKIVSSVKGKVAVFFPAEKETSGLRFHLHGPFVPELSRASIKNSPENTPLFEQLGALTAQSLHSIKSLGLLTGEFLSVLPNNDDALPERYEIIRKSVLLEMRTQPLVPTVAGHHLPAKKLVQARALLKALLSPSDLALLTGRQDEPEWAIGAAQRNSNQDRFLLSLEIPELDPENLQDFLESRTRKKDYPWSKYEIDPGVIGWLKSKSADWFQALYAVLYKHCEDTGYGYLRDAYIVKLANGEMGTPKMAYFHFGLRDETDSLPRVEEEILTIGSKKAQQAEAKKFLEQLGVREPNELDEMVLLLRSRYGKETQLPNDEIYLDDLRKMIEFSERYPTQKSIFANALLFRVDSPKSKWTTAQRVYLDAPFSVTGLGVLYDALREKGTQRWPLAPWYLTCGIAVEKIVEFARFAGCQVSFDELYTDASCTQNPEWDYLCRAPGERYGNGINRDFALSFHSLALIKARRVEAAQLVWDALCRSESKSPSILKACYRLTVKGGAHYSDSQLVHSLRKLEWVPQIDGSYVQPCAAARSKLPGGFVADAGSAWLSALRFGEDERKRESESAERAATRAQLGFRSEEELQRAKEFAALSEDEQRHLLTMVAERKREAVELPEAPVKNTDLRRERVREEAKATPEKSSEMRTRSVQQGVTEAKTEAKLYLESQYKNRHGQMICQVCKDEMPFKLPNGAYYFEAVEAVPDISKRFREGYLALCPNHAAAYLYANAQKNSMRELIAAAYGNEIEVSLGGSELTIYFTQAHLYDMKACFEPETAEE